MRKRNKKSKKSLEAPKSVSTYQQEQQQSNIYEGERLVHLLKSLDREIESAKISQGALPEKIWIKQQFSIGVNDVTRVLERMTPSAGLGSFAQEPPVDCCGHEASSVRLQAVLLASDCNPRWLTKHLPSLASSRQVPLIFIKDKKGGSLRLGELVKLKTAIAIGVKAKGTGINKIIHQILHSNECVGSPGLSEDARDI